MAALLEVANLNKHFGGLHAVKNVTLAIERGEPSWQTRSTSPMSMPSSSEAVATSAFSAPAFSRCSASSRLSRAMLP